MEACRSLRQPGQHARSSRIRANARASGTTFSRGSSTRTHLVRLGRPQRPGSAGSAPLARAPRRPQSAAARAPACPWRSEWPPSRPPPPPERARVALGWVGMCASGQVVCRWAVMQGVAPCCPAPTRPTARLPHICQIAAGGRHQQQRVVLLLLAELQGEWAGEESGWAERQAARAGGGRQRWQASRSAHLVRLLLHCDTSRVRLSTTRGLLKRPRAKRLHWVHCVQPLGKLGSLRRWKTSVSVLQAPADCPQAAGREWQPSHEGFRFTPGPAACLIMKQGKCAGDLDSLQARRPDG